MGIISGLFDQNTHTQKFMTWFNFLLLISWLPYSLDFDDSKRKKKTPQHADDDETRVSIQNLILSYDEKIFIFCEMWNDSRLRGEFETFFSPRFDFMSTSSREDDEAKDEEEIIKLYEEINGINYVA